MKDSEGREITLSIETTIGGGSLAILEGKSLIAVWRGGQQVSKAEDTLERIADLLSENNVEKEQIKLICVSRGIGSLTGEKIGRSIARGLSKALGCRLIELSVFGALRSATPMDFTGQVITAVQFGNDRIIWQQQEKKDAVFLEVSETFTNTAEEFYEDLNASVKEKFIIYSNTFDDWSRISTNKKESVIVLNQNLAAILGAYQYCKEKAASDNS